MKPALLVIAGPNGAGKTTLTARLQQDHWSAGVEYLNPDDIARVQAGLLRKIYGPLPQWMADSVIDMSSHPDFVDLRAA